MRFITITCANKARYFPFGLFTVWVTKDPQFQRERDIYTDEGLLKFVGWWVINGWREFPGVTLAESFAFIAKLDGAALGSRLSYKGLVAQGALREWDYLYSMFSRETGDDQGYKTWWEENARKYFPLLELFESGDCDEQARLCHLIRQPYHDDGQTLREGVSVVGMGNGVLGIGEDARTIAASLDALGVSCRIFNFPPLAPHAAVDRRLEELTCARLERRVNLFTLPAFETARAYVELGAAAFARRFNIGYWQWELPRWPDTCKNFFDYIDEVWVSTRYVRDTMEAASTKPVLLMPLPVEINVTPRGRRSDFGFGDDFVFLSVMDGNSWLRRKNPCGTVKAFQAAFPPERKEPVRLVLKGMNVGGREEWRIIQDMAARDQRVTILDRVMARDELFGLMSAADAILSLHRAEGFGRVPAEALLLNKPIIVTAFSGTMDYATPATAFLVDYDEIPLVAGDYHLWQGQTWAEPKLDSAVAALRSCFENEGLRHARALAGKAYMERNYSSAAAGNNYITRLRELGFA